jgi:neutral ceramidase
MVNVRLLVVGLVVAVSVSGCSTIEGSRLVGTAAMGTGALLAGAMKVDITPPPGYPMGGHSIAGSVGRGVWTRLNATAFYLQDPDGQRVLMISCDLWSMPAGLADRVAELVAKDSRGKGLGRDSILLAAIHTHQSPGNFSSSPAYNILASPQSGFDPALFDFLSSKIAMAALGAIDHAVPAQLELATDSIPGISRNRSMPAFLLDPECRQILAENAAIPLASPTSEYPDPRASQAVDPRLRVLRIKNGAGQVIALAAFCAMHPTAMSHSTELYNGDVFGAAELMAESSLAMSGSNTPVVAIFNGAEGDISPMWQQQDRLTTLRLGRQLAAAIVRCAGATATPVDGRITTEFDLVDIAHQSFTDATGRARQTSAVAQGGSPLMGGAEDGRTLYDYDGYREGSRNTLSRSSTQGAKRDMLAPNSLVELPEWVQQLPGRILEVPHILPLQIIRLGPIWFAALPGEFTTVMGRRIETQLLECTGPDSQVILIGLANEYISYFATPEEFESQQYEGASTLYGPAAAPFVQRELSKLARDLLHNIPRKYPLDYKYVTGPTVSFFPPTSATSLYFFDDGLANVLEDDADGMARRDYPHASWTESTAAVSQRMARSGEPTPYVFVEYLDPAQGWQRLVVNGRAEDNRGLDFVTEAAVRAPAELTWCCYWMPPPGIDRSKSYRLSFPGNGQTSFIPVTP